MTNRAVRAILLSHPHAGTVANEVAAAFARSGILARYVTGLAWNEANGRGLLARAARRLPTLQNRVIAGLRNEQLVSMAGLEFASRAIARASIGKIRGYDSVFWVHDRTVAALRWPERLDAVYAYEDAAQSTFERARRLGIGRIWDLPAPHYRSRERVWTDEPVRWPGVCDGSVHREPRWKASRKDAELMLATGVVVASAYTESTLREAGYTGRVAVIPYGFPVERFAEKQPGPERPFTVLAVGTHSVAKGTQYLLEAWRLAGVKGRLRLVGPLRLGKQFLDRYAGWFDHVSHVPRALLGAEYQAADLVAFPSLGDGFGLVIQEAMCSGTPVVATRCSGAPECIQDGREGWIIPERSLDALVSRIREAAGDRDRLREMGRAGRVRAHRWTWTEAGAALVECMERLAQC